MCVCRYWDVRDAPLTSKPLAVAQPLPSDSRFRDDSSYLAQGNYELAHEYKTMLEESQRYDRKLRQKAAEARKKLAKHHKH